MLPFNIFIVVATIIIAAVALLSVPMKRYVAPPFIAVGAGMLLGAFTPAAALIPSDPMVMLEQATRLTLAVSLMAAALRVDRDDLHRQWKAAAVLLGLLMPLMWLFSSLIAYGVFGFGVLTAFLIGALVTPTDPVLAGSVVTGRLAEEKIPKKLRALISMESGANDGLNYLFVFLPLLLLQQPPGAAVRHWLLITVLWEVLTAAAIGLFIGYVAGRLTYWAEQHEHTSTTAILVFSTALAIFSLAIAKLAGTDGILAVFLAGMVFDYIVEGSRAARAEDVQEAIDLLFTTPTFMLIGMTLPWSDWFALGWTAAVFPILILLFRRMPAVGLIAPLLAKWHGRPRRLLLGWTGPMGISTVFYATLATRLLNNRLPWILGSLVVLSSVIVHGLATPQLVKAFGRHAGEPSE